MNYKEKYKNVIEQLRGLLDEIHEENCEITEEDLIKIFPEIKEEDDIPTWLTKYIEEEAYNLSMDIRDNEDRVKLKKLQQSLAWLEKQGEQQEVPQIYETEDGEVITYSENDGYNVKPKFKVGDWILYSGDGYEGVRHITKINENGYYIERNGLPHGIIPFNHEIYMKLWTILDAKDGDILAEDTCIFIIKKLNNDLSAKIYCCLYDDGDFELNTTLIFDDTCTYPATKEQCDLLFQKIREAGYEWYNHTLIKTEPDEYSDYFKFEGNGEDEISDGKMLLYVLNKGVNQGKKEIAEKSHNFIEMLADKFTILNYETKSIYSKQQLIDDFNEFINK